MEDIENLNKIISEYNEAISRNETQLSYYNKMFCKSEKNELKARTLIRNEEAKHFFLRDHYGLRITKQLLTDILEEQKYIHSRQGQLRSELKILRTSKFLVERLMSEREQLREKLAQVEKAAAVADDIPYTLWRVVLAMRVKGMTDKQIADKLYDKGQGLTKSQIGALLYTGTGELPASKTLQENGTELFR